MRIRGEHGAELVEFAVILPVLMMVLFGIFWFGRLYNIYETMTRAAKEGANYGSRPNCALCGTAKCPVGDLQGFPCPDTTVEQAVIPVLVADHIDLTKLNVIARPNLPSCADFQRGCAAALATCQSYKGEGKIWVCWCVDMKVGANAPSSCGESVTMGYPWQFPFPFSGLSNQVINVSSSAEARVEF